MYTSATVIGVVTKVGASALTTNRNGESYKSIRFVVEAENRRGGSSSVLTICVYAYAKLADIVVNNVGVGSTVVVDGNLMPPEVFEQGGAAIVCMAAQQVTFLKLVRPMAQQASQQAPPPDISEIF